MTSASCMCDPEVWGPDGLESGTGHNPACPLARKEPRTTSGRVLWAGYRAAVERRPDVEGLLWLKAILDIESEAEVTQ